MGLSETTLEPVAGCLHWLWAKRPSPEQLPLQSLQHPCLKICGAFKPRPARPDRRLGDKMTLNKRLVRGEFKQVEMVLVGHSQGFHIAALAVAVRLGPAYVKPASCHSSAGTARCAQRM